MRFGSIPLAVLITVGSTNLRAAQPPATLDQGALHAAYTEGDFEKVVARIDAFTRAHPTYPKDDSVFIAKHLAVIYTANPATREKGKHYMFLLLELLPSAKIVDMFVSDEIDRIFERVKEEFLVRQRALGKETPAPSDSLAGTGPASAAAQSPGKRGSAAEPASRSHAVYWVAGSAALLAATGAATYFLLYAPHPAAKDTVYDIPH